MHEQRAIDAPDGDEATIQERVAARLGVLPNFFCTAASAPGLIDRLWDFARSAYFDSPLPSLFKERLFVHLSRFCEVRYCIVRHVGFLLGLGYPAGDRDCPPQSLDQVLTMLKRPVPREAEFEQVMQRLSAELPQSELPAADTQRETDLFDALTLIFLEPRQSGPVRQAVARVFGDANLEMLTAFLAFVRTAHYWTETHPELEFEPDMLALMREHAELEGLLLNQAEGERTWSPMERARLLSALAAREAQQKLLLRLVQEQRETDDPERIQTAAAEALGRYLNVGIAAFVTIGDDEVPVLEGSWNAEGAVPPDLAACEVALRLGRPLAVTNTLKEMPGLGLAEAGLLALLSKPLDRDGVVTGGLVVGHASIRQWADDEIALVREVAARTRDAVERTRAAAALREEQRTLATLNEVGTVLAAELDLERVVQMVTDAGVDLTGAQFGAFFYNVLDPEGGSYMLYTLSGVDRAAFDKFPMPRNTAVFAPTFGGEGVVRSDDILDDHRYGHNVPHHGMPKGHLPVRSYLAVPVASRSGEVLGGLFFGHPETGRFLPRHERLMVAIAAQAAIAIDNARLFKTAQHEIEERRSAEARLQELNDTLEERIATATAERAQVEERLRQSQKMEAVGQLTGGLAHDFNNLLTGVTGSLELMQSRIAQGRIRDVDRYVNAAQGAAKRAAALTHRLLAFSRRQTLDPKATDVNRLVTGMEELIQRTVGPEITVEPMVGTAGVWPTLVDPGQLENALLNLCINARDAMPNGGKITIETGNRWLDERMARDRDLPPGQYVSLCVSDTGTGMPPEVIAKAFDPFFTTKPIGMGTGLGLSMIYGFAQQSGGQVRIYSEVGQGTMVCLYLPRHLGEAETSELASELTDAPRAKEGQTVLVVDDEPTVRMLVTEVLEDLGYIAIEAVDGAAGLKVLQSDVRIDLLVTDVGLPGGMNGRQMADAGRVVRTGLKVLFITGYAENAVLSHGHLDPGMHVLTKPFAIEALASRIRDLIVK